MFQVMKMGGMSIHPKRPDPAPVQLPGCHTDSAASCDADTIAMDERRPWNAANILLLIGPGGAGKTSLGAELAPLLGRRLVDLDREFLRQVGDIGAFIRDVGYASYKRRNAALARVIVRENTAPMLLVASSGFLTPDNPPAALAANRRLVAACYVICLLPSRDLEHSVTTIVDRQLTRPFARERAREEATIRARYPIYAGLGDLIVFAATTPSVIAQTLAPRLGAES